jgi:hypothetical protein
VTFMDGYRFKDRTLVKESHLHLKNIELIVLHDTASTRFLVGAFVCICCGGYECKKPPFRGGFVCLYNNLELIYFPACDCSIINVTGLNYSVRDGKR